MKRVRWSVLALVLLSTAGCVGMGGGSLEEILAGMGGFGGGVRGEVDWVDTRRQEIELRASFGQRTRLQYDSRTQVSYRGQRYSVRSLQTGDRIAAQVERSRQGESYARQIEVEERARDDGRDGGSGQVGSARFDGEVGWVDTERGRFQLRSSRGTYTVSLPYDASRSMVDRFRRLRAGDDVRIQGELLGNGRIELERFL
jgi:hypothetical protein